MKGSWRGVVKTNMTTAQCRDTGMALVLVLLLFALVRGGGAFIIWATGLHVLNMIAPRLYHPAAIVWFGVTERLGTVVSRVLLSVVFFAVVTPVALVRKALGKDSLQLKIFKAGRESVMEVRDHTFTGPDLERPY